MIAKRFFAGMTAAAMASMIAAPTSFIGVSATGGGLPDGVYKEDVNNFYFDLSEMGYEPSSVTHCTITFNFIPNEDYEELECFYGAIAWNDWQNGWQMEVDQTGFISPGAELEEFPIIAEEIGGEYRLDFDVPEGVFSPYEIAEDYWANIHVQMWWGGEMVITSVEITGEPLPYIEPKLYDFEYGILEDGTVEITSITYYSDEIALVIPEEIDNHPVTKIADYAFINSENLISVTIPEGVKSIGHGAFNNCINLETVTIADSVTEIGSGAFGECFSLTSANLPIGLTAIESGLFNACVSLTDIDIPESVTSIGDFAFRGCEALTSVTVPDSVTSIGECAFELCASMTSVTLSNKLTEIAPSMFSECASLTSIVIPDGVTDIGPCAFYDCASLTDIVIPDSVDEIGYFAFEGTPWLMNKRSEDPLVVVNNILCDANTCTGDVTIPDNVIKISTWAFSQCEDLRSVTIPGSVKTVGFGSFTACGSLESVTMLDGVEIIDGMAFDGCRNLKNATIPDSVKRIDGYAFNGCVSLKSIDLPEGITELVRSSFSATGLESITIPDSVITIEAVAFEACGDLASADIPEGVKNIEMYAFYNCRSLTSVTIPDSVTKIGERAFGYCADYSSDDWQEYKLEGFKIYCYSGTAGEKYAIDNGFDYEIIGEGTTKPDDEMFAKGDVDGDGMVTFSDLQKLAAHVKGVQKVDKPGAADVNYDGEINFTDLQMLAAHIKGVQKLN